MVCFFDTYIGMMKEKNVINTMTKTIEINLYVVFPFVVHLVIFWDLFTNTTFLIKVYRYCYFYCWIFLFLRNKSNRIPILLFHRTRYNNFLLKQLINENVGGQPRYLDVNYILALLVLDTSSGIQNMGKMGEEWWGVWIKKF